MVERKIERELESMYCTFPPSDEINLNVVTLISNISKQNKFLHFNNLMGFLDVLQTVYQNEAENQGENEDEFVYYAMSFLCKATSSSVFSITDESVFKVFSLNTYFLE